MVAEKRKYERIDINDSSDIKIEISSIYSSNRKYIDLKDIGKVFPLQSLDISAGGISFVSPLKLPTNSRYKIKITINPNEEKRELNLIVKLVRSDYEHNGKKINRYGCSFINPKYYEVDIINEYITLYKKNFISEL